MSPFPPPTGPRFRLVRTLIQERRTDFYVHPSNPVLDGWFEVSPDVWAMLPEYDPA